MLSVRVQVRLGLAVPAGQGTDVTKPTTRKTAAFRQIASASSVVVPPPESRARDAGTSGPSATAT